MKLRTIIALAFLFTTSLSFSVDFTVNSFSDLIDDSPGDGNCDATEQLFQCTLRAAIMESNALGGVDTIYLPAGVFTLSIVGEDLDAFVGDLDIREEVHIVGAGMDLTIIDGGGIDRIFQFFGVSGSVSNLTLRNGGNASVTSHGGAILTQGGSMTEVAIDNVKFINNRANDGGAVSFLNGAGSIKNSIFDSNYAVSIGNNEFGAAVSCFYCDFIMDSTQVTNNYDAINAIFIEEGSGMFINSTISSNTGTGLYAKDSDASIRFSTFYNNSEGNLSLYSFDGSNLFEIGFSAFRRVANGNCVSSGVPISLGYNVLNDDSCGLMNIGDMEDTDPMLEPLHQNGGNMLSHMPSVGSPLVDQIPVGDCIGFLANPMTIDQRGDLRPIGDHCDIGAIERDLIFASGFD